MKGPKFLKVTGILMIIGAAFSIIMGGIVGGLGAIVAGFGGASNLTFSYWLTLLLTLGGGICEMVAGVKGVKNSKRRENAKDLLKWGVIALAFSVLSIVTNLIGGGEFSLMSILTGVAIPALYIYGAVLNSKADDIQPTA